MISLTIFENYHSMKFVFFFFFKIEILIIDISIFLWIEEILNFKIKFEKMKFYLI